MKPVIKHLEIVRGSTFSISFAPRAGGQPFDLTGYTARCPLCDRSGNLISASALLTTENGGIAIDTATGTVLVTVLASVTAGAGVEFGHYELTMIPPAGEAYAWKLVQKSNIRFVEDLPNG